MNKATGVKSSRRGSFSRCIAMIALSVLPGASAVACGAGKFDSCHAHRNCPEGGESGEPGTTRGGSPNLSQMLMRWRVILQFVAIVVIMITGWAMGR